ncbi:MAG TPA: SRPBCC domain-containing protein [Flavobacteriaceae bacterium]|nr:SRPBCC domain-containing protein [Flavobacteriaceae bacterium]
MKKLQFSKTINAPVSKVYNTMLGLDNIETYQQWTKVFNPTSTYEGKWKKGTKIVFVGTHEDGTRGGMISEVIENIPNSFVSVKHYGVLDGEKEITTGPEVEKWAGGLENYFFESHGKSTIVTVETDSTEDFIAYFTETWPKALNRLKELSEQAN